MSKQFNDIKELRKMMEMLMEQKGITCKDANTASEEQSSGLEEEEPVTDFEPPSMLEDEASESEEDSIANLSCHN